jgi:hypothetical protein
MDDTNECESEFFCIRVGRKGIIVTPEFLILIGDVF